MWVGILAMSSSMTFIFNWVVWLLTPSLNENESQLQVILCVEKNSEAKCRSEFLLGRGPDGLLLLVFATPVAAGGGWEYGGDCFFGADFEDNGLW